jgi:hypothetical protein
MAGRSTSVYVMGYVFSIDNLEMGSVSVCSVVVRILTDFWLF